MTRLTAAHCTALVESIDDVIASHTALIRAMRVIEAGEPKEHTAHHAAARVALAHLEHILKISGNACEGDGGAQQRAGAVLAEARAEIGAAQEEEVTADDEGRIDGLS